MGRFLSGGSGSVPRQLRQVFENSNPSFAIPSWARYMRVSGVGGGASGGIRATSGSRGSGGNSGFQANELPLIIPTGASTIAVAIGAAGAAVTAAAAANGNAGGDTTLTIGGVLALRLVGGLPGLSSGTAPGSPSAQGALVYLQANNPNPGGTLVSINGGFASTNAAAPHLYGPGLGGDGSQAANGFGVGGSSLFGRGGDGVAAGPTANTNGTNAIGYGAGGSGALWISGGSVTSGAGSPGILICEFLEALT